MECPFSHLLDSIDVESFYFDEAPLGKFKGSTLQGSHYYWRAYTNPTDLISLFSKNCPL
uniref:Uncharacterized protein n=1 Tax=Anguilla anguilla TaxID=7936 RepID=A0A0E9UNF0_ANGAN